MGLEARCTVAAGGTRDEGLARLETTVLRFRGASSFTIPLSDIRKVGHQRGELIVEHAGGTVRLALGPHAGKWALAIRYPRALIDKLGVKPEHVVSVLGLGRADFDGRLDRRAAVVSYGRRRARSDLIFFKATRPPDLEKLAALRRALVPDGAIWVIWPKGRKALREDDVRRAGKTTGLVDVKVVSFSEELSGLKLVVPVKDR